MSKQKVAQFLTGVAMVAGAVAMHVYLPDLGNLVPLLVGIAGFGAIAVSLGLQDTWNF